MNALTHADLFDRSIFMTPFRISLIAAATVLAFPVAAQTAPDAGQLLQQNRPPVLQAPKPSAGIQIQTPVTMAALPGGVEVKLTSVSLQGNTLFTEAQLLDVLNADGSIVGKSYDLASLRGLTEKISAHYRSAGYPFARAILPAQSLSGGALPRVDTDKCKPRAMLGWHHKRKHSWHYCNRAR
jgi:hemolysin activation/secretion protein